MSKEEKEETHLELDKMKVSLLENFTYGKLFFLSLMSLALSVVGPLSIFSPLPMAAAFLFYGNVRTFSISGVILLISIFISSTFVSFSGILYYGIIQNIATVFACVVVMIIREDEHPVRGLIKKGVCVVGCILLLIGLVELVTPLPISEMVEKTLITNFELVKEQPEMKKFFKSGGKQARAMESILNRPKEVLSDLYKIFFPVIFVGVFFILWMTLFMVLKNNNVWKNFNSYSYGLEDLIKFKVPEKFAYLVIFGLGLFLLGDIWGKNWSTIGANILYSLGVFYFFQGIGIYLSFLTYIKVTGFFKSMLVLIVIFTAYRPIAVLGLFDMWIDFRKFFKEKEN